MNKHGVRQSDEITIKYYITDHFPIMLTFDKMKRFKTSHKTVERRIFSNENVSTLRNAISLRNWNALIN